MSRSDRRKRTAAGAHETGAPRPEVLQGRDATALPERLAQPVTGVVPRSHENFVPLDLPSGTIRLVALIVAAPALVGVVAAWSRPHLPVLVTTALVALAIAAWDHARVRAATRKVDRGLWPYGLYRVDGGVLRFFRARGDWIWAPDELVSFGTREYSREQGPSGVARTICLGDTKQGMTIDVGMGSAADRIAAAVAGWLGRPAPPSPGGPV